MTRRNKVTTKVVKGAFSREYEKERGKNPGTVETKFVLCIIVRNRW